MFLPRVTLLIYPDYTLTVIKNREEHVNIKEELRELALIL